MDSYQKCDCGSGEKYKFCCQKAEAFLMKIDRLLDSDQEAAAVAIVEEAIRKFPDTPSLLIRQALLNSRGDQIDDHVIRSLEAYLAKHPKHIGIRNVYITMILASDGPEAAALELQRSISRMSEADKRTIASLPLAIGEAFLNEDKPLAGLNHASLSLIWSGGNGSIYNKLTRIQQARELSLWLRSQWTVIRDSQRVPESVRDEFSQTCDLMKAAHWLDASESFARIAARDTSGQSYWNQGLCLASLGENFGAVECMRAYTAILGETEEAVDVEALCQELEPPGEEDLVDHLQLTWPVRSGGDLIKALEASERFVDLDSAEKQAEKAAAGEPRSFALLDFPKLKPGEPIDIDKVPSVVATVTIDNRNASLAALDDGQLDATTEFFRETAGSAIVPAHPRTKHLGKLLRLDPMEDYRWFLQREIPETDQADLFERRFVRDLETVWPVTPQKYLAKRTPVKAAADGDARVPLRAALMRLAESPYASKADQALANLRQRLSLPEEPPPVADSIRNVAVARLKSIDLKSLSVEQLKDLFARATLYGLVPLLSKVGEEWCSRPTGDDADAEARLKLYSQLSSLASEKGDLPLALELIARGHAEDRVHEPEYRDVFWALNALRCKALILQPAEWVPELAVILNRKRDNTETDAEITELIITRLVELGLVRISPHPDRPDQFQMDTRMLEAVLQTFGPKITTASGELGVSVAKPQIWTPGSASPSQAGKIWTPGQSATPQAPSAQGSGSKLFVPGQ